MVFPRIFAHYLTDFRETLEQNSAGRHVTGAFKRNRPQQRRDGCAIF